MLPDTYMLQYAPAVVLSGPSCRPLSHSAGRQELGSQCAVALIFTPPDRRACMWSHSADAAHLDAHMPCGHVNSHRMRLQDFHHRICDLPANALLDRKTARVQTHQADELRKPKYVFVRDVPDVYSTIERERMVLAKRGEGDRSFDYLAQPAVRSAAALGVKDPYEFWIAFIALSGIEQRLQEAARRVGRGRKFQIQTASGQDFRDVTLKSSCLLL